MADFSPIPGVSYKHDYPAIFKQIASGKLPRLETYRQLCQEDLFFVLCFGLNRVDANKPFVVNAIREVEENHANTLDLWAREHFKSSVLTYALPIQELIQNPEERIAIFSHTRPIAKGFLRQLKQTLEGDVPIKRWFPDVFYKNPRSDAPKWSEDDGLIVRRKSHAKEASIEAWGLVDGQPTSKHFTIRIYDDVVTRDSVTTPEQLKKVLEAYELSQSLGTDGGTKRVVGTHYHFADLYQHLRKKTGYTVRVKPATEDGTATGAPVLLSRDRLDELRREQGPYVFACQQLLVPIAVGDQTFSTDWLRFYGKLPNVVNKYLVCDPANEKKKGSDYTVMAVIAVDSERNRFLVDMVRGRLNLTERWEALRDLWSKHKPYNRIGYEKYGMQSDVQYFEEKQRDEATYFPITTFGGQVAKGDRIRKLVPVFESGKFYLPHHLYCSGEDLVKTFVNDEYSTFPYCAHDDMLDCISRIEDEAMEARPPVPPAAVQAARAKTDYNVFRGASYVQ